ncbi:dual serine/threonine and tyrosine protein kinase-like [Neocloeon triangulifer]|uniref:dual serine/threonine and tyrosine protein kinase-like n=1 Tax=Neocloeon triangulifer TaxID=2078957 RepID=UPI00286EDE83|nr:dual serine/threonine and tyrosine protein kinase-like [Neocloeon triangulifer]
MSNKLLHGYKRFLRNTYDLRRILRETRQLLEDLAAPHILPSEKSELIAKIQRVDDVLRKFPAIVAVGPLCFEVLRSIFGQDRVEQDDEDAFLRVVNPTSVYPPLKLITEMAVKEEIEVKEVQLGHSLLRDGLQVLVTKRWSHVQLDAVLPIALYGVRAAELSVDDLSDLRRLRADWPDLPLCLICMQNDTKERIQQQLNSLDFGPIVLIDDHNGFSAFVKSCLQNHLVSACLHLNEVQSTCIRSFILSAFDMARELQITPKRLQYVQDKESELHQSLIRVASDKQQEITELIEHTIQDMREALLDKASECEAPLDVAGNADTIQAAQAATNEVQQMVLSRLSSAVATQLASTVGCLQDSYVGTLQRCLESLEKHCLDAEEGSIRATDALRQSLSAAYSVEISACPSSPFFSMFDWIRSLMKGIPLPWTSPPSIDSGWRRTVAADILDSLSASKLARGICSQFRVKVRCSHDSFQKALCALENRICGKLERTEEQRVAIRKHHAPQLARLSLETTSMCDLVRYGMPRLGREIGRGQYGVVFSCDPWGGFSPCAVKSVVPPDDKHWNDLAMEFYYTRTLPEHRRIVRVRGSVIDSGYGGGCSPAVLLIMDRLSKDLYCGLRAGMSWLSRLQVAVDVAEGVRFLHAQGLVHRDIKLKNVLLDEENRAKLTDLGFCIPEAMMSGSIVGTPIHMAPELLSGHYDSSVDVYALGILFWYICAGHVRMPYVFEQFCNKEQLWKNVKSGLRPERLPHFDEQCWRLMEQCWSAEPSQRPLLGYVQPQLEAIMRRYQTGESMEAGSSSSDAAVQDDDSFVHLPSLENLAPTS